MNKSHMSVYIHIPFCKQICSYCDFPKMLYNEEFVLNYLLSLEKEIIDNYNHEKINTIYIGGGTPSTLSIATLKKLMNIIQLFDITEDVEFTFECNLDDIREEMLYILKENNVNRLSIGIQSFSKNKLEILEREADYNDALYKIKLCRKLGFNNINIDLMYALEDESYKDLKNDLSKINSLKPEHISTYSLIIENNTKLKFNNTKPIDDKIDSKMYKIIRSYLKKKGYIHYEVSNFSKPGRESKHNLVYWNNEEYYGFGLGAAGYYGGVRYNNTKNLTKYLNKDFSSEKDMLSKKEIMDFELILGFRKLNGINIKEFNNKYNTDIYNEYNISNEIKNKNLILKNNMLYINPKKIYIMNEILTKLI